MESSGVIKKESIAIPFIKYDVETQGFNVTQEAIEFLRQIPGKMGIISVCGKYRTGKSYLLNKLFMEKLDKEREENNLKKSVKGFQVGPTINPCTKGLWIWKQVFYSETDEDKMLPIIIIDTEGLGAFDEEHNHDTKIFLLAMLLSSLLIYNSMGPIDENALNNLSLVVNLSKSLQIKKGEAATDADEMAQYFPSFLWILRDFALRLEDQDGNIITQKKYLENSLQEQKGMSDAIEAKNRIRRLVRQFFVERDCHTLVRPIEDEKGLQNLNDLKSDNLRSEFVTQIDHLRRKVFKKVKPKQLKGQFITGHMLIELAEAYTESLNKGGIPVIETAWEYMQSNEIENAFKEALAFNQKQIDVKVIQKLPMLESKIDTLCKDAKKESIKMFHSLTLGDIKNSKNTLYMQKMKQEFNQKKVSTYKRNKDTIQVNCLKILDQIFTMSIKQKQVQGQYSNLIDLHADFVYVQQEFMSQIEQQWQIKDSTVAQKTMFEYFLDKQQNISSDIFYQTTQNTQNQYKLTNEKMKQSEKNEISLREELAYVKKNTSEEIQDLEAKKIQVMSQMNTLDQKVLSKNSEIQKLQMNVNSKYSENKLEMESLQNMLKDQELRLKKKDNEIRDILDKQYKTQSDKKKDEALLEQQIELQQRQIEILQNQLDEKGDNGRVKSHEIKELMDMIKELKKDNKQLRAREQQSTSQGDISKLQIQLEKQIQEKAQLEKQILHDQNQYIKLHEKLINAEKIIKNLSKNDESSIQTHKKENLGEKLETIQQQLQDSEQSNKVLRRIKNAYKQAAEIKCRGCQKVFQPVIFKGHILNCQKLFEDPESFQDIAQNSDIDQVFIKALKYDEAKQDLTFQIKFGSKNTFREFEKQAKFAAFQDLLLNLAEQNLESDVFKNCKNFEKVIFIDAECYIENVDGLLKNTNTLLQKMTQMFALKTNERFKRFFNIGNEFYVPPSDEVDPLSMTSGSLLRQSAGVGRKKI